MRKAGIIAAVLTAPLCWGSAAADPGLASLIMPDAKVVGGINVAQARTTPFGRFFLARLAGEEKGFQELQEATGFDPRRDVVEILFASGGEPGSMGGLVLARGTFDAARIGNMIRGAGKAPENYQGVDIYTTKQDARALAFLDPATAVAGEIELVKAAIDRRTKPTVLDRAVSGRIAALSANQHVWGMTLAPLANLSAQAPDSTVGGLLQGDVFKSIEYAGGGLNFGDNVVLVAEALTHTEKDAAAMADALRFLANLAAMQGSKGGGTNLTHLLQALKLTSEGNVVKVSAEVPESEFEKLLGQRAVDRPVPADGPR